MVFRQPKFIKTGCYYLFSCMRIRGKAFVRSNIANTILPGEWNREDHRGCQVVDPHGDTMSRAAREALSEPGLQFSSQEEKDILHYLFQKKKQASAEDILVCHATRNVAYKKTVTEV